MKFVTVILSLLISNFAFSTRVPRFIVKPYLQFATQTGITILWETSEPGKSWVEYGPALYNATAPNLSRRTMDFSNTVMHTAVLDSLQAETVYFYRAVTVAAGGDSLISEVSCFKTAVKDNTPFAFTVFSDSQNNPEAWGRISELAYNERPNFALHGGDIVDYGYVKSNWVDHFMAPGNLFMSKYPIYSIPGNHEHDAPYYYQYMRNPGNGYFYSFRYGNAQFFMLNTSYSVLPGSEQYDWLEWELAHSTATWKIVTHHYPPFSSDENDFGDTRKSLAREGNHYLEPARGLYEKYGVDIVFYGHIHTYERTWPIYKGKPTTKGGVIYLNVGGSGGDLEHSAPLRSWFTNKVKTAYHFGSVKIHENDLQFQAIDETGAVFDAFELKKEGNWHDVTAVRKMPPAPHIIATQSVFTNQLSVSIDKAFSDLEVRYTTDGSNPTRSAALYKAPLQLSQSVSVKAVAFSKEGSSNLAERKFVKQEFFNAQNAGTLNQGLNYRYGSGTIKSLDDFEKLSFEKTGVTPGYNFEGMFPRAHFWGAAFTGYIRIDSAGVYRFTGHGENWLRFSIDDQLLIDEFDRDINNGNGGPGEIALQAGLHRVKILYYDVERPASIDLFMQKIGGERKALDPALLFH
ncbi:hypothetical protein A4H97_21535 [Niastella yeongjuensis]|uniref:PA14 domain-containing protein n=1 Tax=Niastella yeongjuensis TaxID=354355 RepID=A0A1V9F863_9BACT|nr:metallophosphoesterase [Niastella yeongjuensis]OQP54554.1 hypothetical protein A4H97_21535 [Niastella yeongjuensis]SEN98831.1 PA14 domain-containing protein [Niastella yeongjuensis]